MTWKTTEATEAAAHEENHGTETLIEFQLLRPTEDFFTLNQRPDSGPEPQMC